MQICKLKGLKRKVVFGGVNKEVGGTNGRKKKMVAKGINFDNLMANRVMNSIFFIWQASPFLLINFH